ncbi:MAG: hypothetical protein AB1798_12330 [Spirochaetota bacterium]
MEPLILMALLVLIFYILIPGAGAFYVRNQWRVFRKNIIEASLNPMVTYKDLKHTADDFIDTFRFFGTLEAIQDENLIWIRNGDISLSAELEKSYVYILPSFSYVEKEGRFERNKEVLPDEMPRKIPWDKIFSLPQGTKIFLSGPLVYERGKCVFKTAGKHVLSVVIYDGDEHSILRRSIWAGRQRNEYWNQFTPGSLAAGSFSLFILAYTFLRIPMQRLVALITLTISLLPVLVLIPPGLLLFFFYRNLWKQARFLRAERDLLMLPLRYFADVPGEVDFAEVHLPGGEPYIMKKCMDIRPFEITQAEQSPQIRTTALIRAKGLKLKDFYVFGVKGDKGMPAVPGDPMVEYLIVPGHPSTLSRQCAGKARKLEIFSALAFSAGLLINVILFFELLREIIK